MLGAYALSSGYYDAYYLKAQKIRTLIKRDFDEAFQKFDALVAPTSPTVAFRIGERTDPSGGNVPVRCLHDSGQSGGSFRIEPAVRVLRWIAGRISDYRQTS